MRADLDESFKVQDELYRSLSILQRKLNAALLEKKHLEEKFKFWPIKMIFKICNLIGSYK